MRAQSVMIQFWQKQSPVMRGVLMMCISTMAFSVMHVTIRQVSFEVPVFQVVFLRNLFGLLFLMPMLMSGGMGSLRTDRIGLHMFRAVLNIIAMMMFFYALTITPLAKTTALSFISPIFAAALSVLVLKERFRLHRWAAIGAGFVGMLIILRPGVVEMDTGGMLVVFAASFAAVTIVVIKVLSRTDSSVTIAAWMAIFLSLLSVGPAIWVWVWPSAAAWGWLFVIGFFGTIAQLSISQALKETDPTAVLPFDFLKLVWTALLAAWLFGEIPDLYTWIGAGVIFASGLYIAQRERQAKARGQA